MAETGITTEQADRIISLLENIDLNNAESFIKLQEFQQLFETNFPVFFDTSRIILTYGFVYVPLIFVVLMLWWLFKQFIQKY